MDPPKCQTTQPRRELCVGRKSRGVRFKIIIIFLFKFRFGKAKREGYTMPWRLHGAGEGGTRLGQETG